MEVYRTQFSEQMSEDEWIALNMNACRTIQKMHQDNEYGTVEREFLPHCAAIQKCCSYEAAPSAATS